MASIHLSSRMSKKPALPSVSCLGFHWLTVATNDLHPTNQHLQDTSVALSHVPIVASVDNDKLNATHKNWRALLQNSLSLFSVNRKMDTVSFRNSLFNQEINAFLWKITSMDWMSLEVVFNYWYQSAYRNDNHTTSKKDTLIQIHLISSVPPSFHSHHFTFCIKSTGTSYTMHTIYIQRESRTVIEHNPPNANLNFTY